MARLFGSFLGKATGIDSFAYWGKSVEVVLVAGGVLEVVGLGVFVLF